MRVLITGAAGQLGRALIALAPDDATVRGASYRELDIADAPAVGAVLREFRPDALINAAGFTRVDDALAFRKLIRCNSYCKNCRTR